MHPLGALIRCGKAVWLFVALAAVGALLASGSPAGAGGGTIFGEVYEDLNRDQIRQADEAPLAGQQLYLYDANGAYLGTTLADSAGHYSFSGLADGDYRVDCEASSIRYDWVPTTTGSAYPELAVHVAGSATADFGWRPIVRSTDLASPIGTYTGPNGLRVETFTDAVPAQTVYDTLTRGTLVGAEAAKVTLRFGYGETTATSSSAVETNGTYIDYHATAYVTYASWLNEREVGLFHEYGHAWSLYYAFLVQQDPSLWAYLGARGLAGDPRVNSSYVWSARELIAEDYRQLFGAPSAQAAPQMNRDLPRAADIPGLLEFLATTFREPPPLPTPPPAPPPPPPELAVTGLAVAPTPVVNSAMVAFTLSVDASVTLKIMNPKGKLVRTVLSNAAKVAGIVTAAWDRRNGSGRKVPSGSYLASVVAVDAAGRSVSASAKFRVS